MTDELLQRLEEIRAAMQSAGNAIDQRDAEIERLRAEVAVLQRMRISDHAYLTASENQARQECEEQARLNGMGSEREAALMSRAERAESELAALRKRVEEAPTCDIRFDDIGAIIDARPPRDWIGKRVALVVLD